MRPLRPFSPRLTFIGIVRRQHRAPCIVVLWRRRRGRRLLLFRQGLHFLNRCLNCLCVGIKIYRFCFVNLDFIYWYLNPAVCNKNSPLAQSNTTNFYVRLKRGVYYVWGLSLSTCLFVCGLVAPTIKSS